MGIDGFTLTELREVGDEDKTIPSCLDTRTVTQPNYCSTRFAAERILRPKKTDRPKLDRFKFLVLDGLNARRVSAELQLEGQSEPMGLFGV